MRITSTLLLLALCTGLAVSAQAQITSISQTQDVTIIVDPINAFEIPTGSLSITISGVATIGAGTASATDNSTGYNITTNGSGLKITGALNNDYATGISLKVLLGTPTAQGSSGSAGTAVERTLTTSSQDLITGMTRVAGTGVQIGYTAEATADAAPNDTGEENTVIYTLTNS